MSDHAMSSALITIFLNYVISVMQKNLINRNLISNNKVKTGQIEISQNAGPKSFYNKITLINELFLTNSKMTFSNLEFWSLS